MHAALLHPVSCRATTRTTAPGFTTPQASIRALESGADESGAQLSGIAQQRHAAIHVACLRALVLAVTRRRRALRQLLGCAAGRQRLRSISWHPLPPRPARQLVRAAVSTMCCAADCLHVDFLLCC